MKTVLCMTAGCTISWALVTAIFAPQAGLEVLLGMIAPLAVAIVTLVLVERTYRRDPRQLTRLMITAFVSKLVLFGVYLTIVIGVFSLKAFPFIVSFVTYFVVLHFMEAVRLRRLFSG